MKARSLAQYMLHLQEQGELTWDSEVRIDVNGKEYELADFMGHQMPTNDVEDWYYLLKAEIPGEDKVDLIDIHYRRMKHALGMDHKKAKDGVYEAYRNGSVYGTFDSIWEDLQLAHTQISQTKGRIDFYAEYFGLDKWDGKFNG